MKKNNFIENLNILDGRITYNDFDIDESIPFENQKWSYKEDILQIEYGKRFTLDVGWYPEFQPKGHFTVNAIQDHDWMNPLSRVRCHTLAELKVAIEKAAVLLVAMQKVKGLPYRDVEFETFD